MKECLEHKTHVSFNVLPDAEYHIFKMEVFNLG